MFRKYALFFTFALALVFCAPLSVSAATIYANYTSGNDTTGNGSSGSPYKTFTKAYTVSASGDTLNLSGTFDWTNSDETGDTASGFTIAKSLTIQGHGAGTTTVQSNAVKNTATNKVFNVTGNPVTITDMTIKNGKGTGGGCLSAPNATTLTLRNVSFVDCVNNGDTGGAIQSKASPLTIENSSFVGNSTISHGGGLSVVSGIAYITNSTFSENAASSLSPYSGGAIAIFTAGTSVRVTNTTISGNSAYYGGGVYVNAATDVQFKNTILSGNTASGATDRKNIYVLNSGSLISNGYNIFGSYSTTYFNATTTADWDDRDGDGVFALYGSGTTGTLSLAATTTVENGTYALPFQTGSIGINAGTTTANGGVSIPSTDQRGASRNGGTDIGAYEYGGMIDSGPPSVTLTLPANGATIGGSAVGMAATASDDVAVAGVKFYVDGVLQGVEDTTSAYGITWDSTATSTGSHSAFAVARDTSNNYATSSTVSFTVDNTPPVISAVATTTTATTATITWTTDELASSLINFGLTSSYGTSTAETDISPRVTSHSVIVVGLVSCSRYHYQVQSKDAATNTATSTDATLLTAGCTGSAAISATGQGTITTAAGGVLTQGSLTLTVPVSFTATSSSATFQAQQLNGSTFFTTAGAPTGKTRAGDTVFNLKALTDATTTLSSFLAALTVTLSYSASDVAGLDESTLAIYRYDGSVWTALSACSTNTSARTVTCTTSNFSDFAIFGSAAAAASSSSSTSSGGNGPIFTGTAADLPGYVAPRLQTIYADGHIAYAEALPAIKNIIATTTTQKEPAMTVLPVLQTPPQNISEQKMFTRTLRPLMSDSEVRELQRFLNLQGYIVAKTGVGSQGKESDYFGTLTQLALVKFQEAHTAQVLAPLGLKKGTGIFGPSTRALVNSLLQDHSVGS